MSATRHRERASDPITGCERPGRIHGHPARMSPAHAERPKARPRDEVLAPSSTPWPRLRAKRTYGWEGEA